jgi:energy-converting hydrogenase Eha subunit A
MKPSFNEKLIAYLTLFSGLAISAVAEYYSIMGLMAIYPAAVIPIVIMGIVLGLGKISGTVWLKQNWENAPFFLRAYILPAVVALMLITSLGVFGYLSKAHSDQSLVSGDVQSKIAVYDEKIKTEKDNIEANRNALKQMDAGVDQILGRSADEKGADKAVALRKAQQKERVRLQAEILQSQKSIAELNDARAPIAAEVRKVEAEVGPIKYIAHLLYGENPDANILEKAVIWVTVLIVIVLDPLAVILLLASQYSFQYFREREAEEFTPVYVADVGEPPTVEEKEAEGDSPTGPDVDVISTDTTVTELPKDPHPPGWMYVDAPHYEPDDGPLTEEQIEQLREIVAEELPTGAVIKTSSLIPEEQPEYVTIDGQRMHHKAAGGIYNTSVPTGAYVQNEEQSESSKWNRVISEAEYRDQAQLKKQDDSKNNTDNTA